MVLDSFRRRGEYVNSSERRALVLAIQNAKVIVNKDWCKKCGICVAFCPKKVLANDELGRVIIAHPDQCIACLICEHMCPEYAIDIEVSKE